MSTNIKNITIEFVCNNCLRKKSICLRTFMTIDTLTKRIINRKCLACGRGGLDISHVNFFYDSDKSLIGEK